MSSVTERTEPRGTAADLTADAAPSWRQIASRALRRAADPAPTNTRSPRWSINPRAMPTVSPASMWSRRRRRAGYRLRVRAADPRGGADVRRWRRLLSLASGPTRPRRFCIAEETTTGVPIRRASVSASPTGAPPGPPASACRRGPCSRALAPCTHSPQCSQSDTRPAWQGATTGPRRSVNPTATLQRANGHCYTSLGGRNRHPSRPKQALDSRSTEVAASFATATRSAMARWGARTRRHRLNRFIPFHERSVGFPAALREPRCPSLWRRD